MTGSAKVHKWCLVRAVFLLPATAAAQQPAEFRRSFTFLDDRLVVQVAAEIPGELKVIRGERGKVDVAGRAADGTVAAGLGGSYTPHLRLTATGEGPVEYLVVVPEHVRIKVESPGGRGDPSLSQKAGYYRWGPGPSSDPQPPARPPMADLHASGRVPASIDLPVPSSIRSLSVRLEGSRFRIAAAGPVGIIAGTNGQSLALVGSGELSDIVIYVPPRTPFELRIGGRRVFEAGAGLTPTCEGVTAQRPSADRAWYTFYPQSGLRGCG